MCGIAGRFNFRSGRPVEPERIVAMCDLIAHRGPDEAGVYANGAVGMGHRRLSIIDLTPTGRQPMASPDDAAMIVFNGEIYNFAELRHELEGRGHRFRGRSDTEILLAAYLEFGAGCLQRLRGMFAFAIWNSRDRSLFIARDRLGKKPLHYRLDSDGIAFASEAKAFFAEPSFSASPDLEAISHYLSYQYVPSPYSAFAGVHKLPPASYMVVRDGSVTVDRYWRLSYGRKRKIDEEEAARELMDRLEEAVRIRLVSDVPLGAFLSGGVDSSAVVAIMAKMSSEPVKTYSIGFQEDEYNELPHARLVAERYGTDHHEFVVRPEAADVIPRVVWHYDEPFADESAIPTYHLARLTRQHVTVALNGDAGDENFSGYSRYVADQRLARFDTLPAIIRQWLLQMMRGIPGSHRSDSLRAKVRDWAARAASTPEMRYVRRVMHFPPELKEALCTGELAEIAARHDSSKILLEIFTASDAVDFIDAMLDVDVNHYLPDCLLVKVDIATMAHGLEGRSPLLDHEFMEFAATLPAGLKRRGAGGKYIFRKAIRELVPDAILNRRKKGFGVPLDHWFRQELRELTSDLLLTGAGARRGLFDQTIVQRLIEEHVAGTANHQAQLWNLLMLEQWFQTFIDTRPQVPSCATTGSVVAAVSPVA